MTGLKSILDRYPTGRMMMWLIAVVFFGSIAVYISITTIIDIMLMGKITPRISMKCRQREYIVKNQNRIDIPYTVRYYHFCIGVFVELTLI
jgi:hypothetical protein